MVNIFGQRNVLALVRWLTLGVKQALKENSRSLEVGDRVISMVAKVLLVVISCICSSLV